MIDLDLTKQEDQMEFIKFCRDNWPLTVTALEHNPPILRDASVWPLKTDRRIFWLDSP